MHFFGLPMTFWAFFNFWHPTPSWWHIWWTKLELSPFPRSAVNIFGKYFCWKRTALYLLSGATSSGIEPSLSPLPGRCCCLLWDGDSTTSSGMLTSDALVGRPLVVMLSVTIDASERGDCTSVPKGYKKKINPTKCLQLHAAFILFSFANTCWFAVRKRKFSFNSYKSIDS